jgi:hypothetical protein
MEQHVVNDRFQVCVAEVSFQSFCLERNEYLSFGEIHIVDVSDVTLNGDLDDPIPDPLDPETPCSLQKGKYNLNGYTGNNHVLNMYENFNLTEFERDQDVRVAEIPASGAVPLSFFGTGLFRWLRKRKIFC